MTTWKSTCRWISLAFCAVVLAGCEPAEESHRSLDVIGEEYIILSLAAGQHDDNFIDAYYGPQALAEKAESDTRNIEQLRADASLLLEEVRELPTDLDPGRAHYIEQQLVAMVARLGFVQGVEQTFDHETQQLFDTLPPRRDLDSFDGLRARVEALLPGDAPLPQKVDEFRRQFVIADEHLDAVFERAIAECRDRTLQHIALPGRESFRLEYVTDKPWSGYNWYQGSHHSLIQLNRSLPIELDRVVHLGCHEGYPGHHTYNSLIESTLVDGKGWTEFTVYPLFSPQSLIAEGSANYGVELAFPGDQLMRFEKDVLLPLTDIDAADYETYWKLRELLDELQYAEIQIGRDYLDGNMDREAAGEALIHYTLLSPERAEQRVGFIETYRGYIINYTLGRDIVADWVERQGDTNDARWKAFADLLSSPRLPSDLR